MASIDRAIHRDGRCVPSAAALVGLLIASSTAGPGDLSNRRMCSIRARLKYGSAERYLSALSDAALSPTFSTFNGIGGRSHDCITTHPWIGEEVTR